MSIRMYILQGLREYRIHLLVIFSLFLFTLFILRLGLVPAMVLAVLPVSGYILIRFMEHPSSALIAVFAVSYLLMGLTRYIPGLPAGVLMDGCLLMLLFFSLLRARDSAVEWKNARNPFTLLTGIWLLYCILLVFNPLTTSANWAAGVRGLALYLFLFPLLTALFLHQYRYLKLFLFVWSLLTLLAVAKALVQKYIGFDATELYWLNVTGGRRTHLIYSGTRYFSFFTDAASFGCSMGMSMVVFLIAAFYMRARTLFFYYMTVAILAGYGMMISGTRAAIAVPFVGFTFFIILSKQWKILIPGGVFILLIFVFFKFTYIGHGNTEIRRMRSAFNVTRDASYMVRKSNQEKMRTFMHHHPFGVGVGEAKRADPGDYLYQLPTDTSLVYVWVETGSVGLLLFISIFFVTFARGWHDVWFVIHDRRLRGVISAILAGTAGMFVSAYGNEAFQQLPNGPIVYMCMAFIFMGRKFDKELTDEEAA